MNVTKDRIKGVNDYDEDDFASRRCMLDGKFRLSHHRNCLLRRQILEDESRT